MKFLSYNLSKSAPGYGPVKQKIDLKAVRSLLKGDSCQIYKLSFQNHWGTHIDCPAHFFESGKNVTDYEADFWFFRHPQVISVKAEPGGMISKLDFPIAIDREADLLILKSGWSKFRQRKIYSLKNPGIAPEVGVWLRREYPKLRAIGFDWISLSSYAHRELGRDAHKAFLNPKAQGSPITIIENMYLPKDLKNLKEVWVAPLRVEGIDSAPCTVIGVFA